MKAGITSKDLTKAKKVDDAINSDEPVEDMDIPEDSLHAAAKVKNLYSKLSQIEKNNK